MTERNKFEALINNYLNQKKKGGLNNSSEEDIRGWIDELLIVFGWDTKNTLQVAKEKTLSAAERKLLSSIGSRHSRPDYTLKNNETRLCFVDAKNINEDISISDEYAFQIRSYGYSINAPISIITNFEQIVVYDCRPRPSSSDNARVSRLCYYRIEDYLEHYIEISQYLNREKLLSGLNLTPRSSIPVDEAFANELRDIRLSLGRAIASSTQNKPTPQDLNFLTQTIINRVLFIRVCESRGLEKDGLLKDFEAVDFWAKFSESSYGNFYEKYDGPLFQKTDGLKKFQLSNTAFTRFLSLLYYPSPYCFDVISLKSISDIYDLFLGYQLEYDAAGNVVDIKRIDVSKTGVVTTPKEVVDKVITSTIKQKRLKKASLQDILNFKILDPACGSGSFLIGAFDILEAEINRRNQKCLTRKSPGYCKSHGKALLDIDGRKEIICNCLYGVDINREAVEVAKLSLSLRILDGYDSEDFYKVGLTGSQILHGIGQNIKCGNTLVSDNVFESHPEIQNNILELVETNVFNWEKAFPTIVKKEESGFDFIIGNPPYVEVKNYNRRLPTMAAYIREEYGTCQSGKVDLSMPFIEKALSLLAPQKGVLGFITQKRFFKADYGDNLRNKLTKQRLLSEIYDYANLEVFKGLNTYVSVLVCDLGENNTYLKYTNLSSGKQKNIPLHGLDDEDWCLENYDIYKLAKSKRTKLGSLIDVSNISDGIQVLWKDAYEITVTSINNGLIQGSTRLSSNIEIEEGACRALVRNDSLGPFIIPKYSRYVIFPFDIIGGQRVSISFSDFKKRFPKAAKYLEDNRQTIEDNVQTVPVRNRNSSQAEDWHLYTRRNNLEKTGLKVCIPVISLEPQACIIKDLNVYADNANVYYLEFSSGDLDKMYAIAAIVNSTPFSAFAKCFAQPQANGYWKFNKQALIEAPFPKDAINNYTDPVKRLTELGKEIERNIKAQESLGSLADRLQPALDKAWREIDTICNHLYGLTESEIRLLYEDKRRDRNEKKY